MIDEADLAGLERLTELTEVDTSEIVEGMHPYERASETDRARFDAALERRAVERESREQLAARLG